MGFKAPRGYGFLTNPKKALYNRIYNRTSIPIDDMSKPVPARSGPTFGGDIGLSENILIGLIACAIMVGLLVWLGFSLKWALLLTAIGGITAIVGEENIKLIIFIVLAVGIFLF